MTHEHLTIRLPPPAGVQGSAGGNNPVAAPDASNSQPRAPALQPPTPDNPAAATNNAAAPLGAVPQLPAPVVAPQVIPPAPAGGPPQPDIPGPQPGPPMAEPRVAQPGLVPFRMVADADAIADARARALLIAQEDGRRPTPLPPIIQGFRGDVLSLRKFTLP